MNEIQHFFKGDVVRLAETFPSSMEHFPGRGKIALVVGSYADQYGYHVGEHTYTLNVEGEGEVSWYSEKLMTLVIGAKDCGLCGQRLPRIGMNCRHCRHSEQDHGPASGRWQNKITGKWDIVIPGRMCFYEENIGHQEDFCPCPGFEAEKEKAAS